ncbi:MAG TPA: nuclear transport factor 2 family protein [Candidatus Udaeobacter sp.]|nr:nuclear transport factor 2 family protein [Candidatus Udaeobacter sp.]
MKREFILCCFSLVAAVSICFGQESPSPSPFKPHRSATKEKTIVELEKKVTEAFKNKRAEEFKRYLAPEFVAIDAQGIENVDAQLADMEKYDVRENTFADMKTTFPSPKVAVLTYKVSTQATHDGQETSGTYNVASVWMKRGGNWLLICHAFMKTQ